MRRLILLLMLCGVCAAQSGGGGSGIATSFSPTPSLPATCSPGSVRFDNSPLPGTFNGCTNNNSWEVFTTGTASSAFSSITSGTNSTATMTCGTGCIINTSGSGSIVATSAGSVAWDGLTVPTGNLSLLMPADTSSTFANAAATGNITQWQYSSGVNGISTSPYFIIRTGTNDTAPPLRVTASGSSNGVQVDKSGVLASFGTGGYAGRTLGLLGVIVANPGAPSTVVCSSGSGSTWGYKIVGIDGSGLLTKAGTEGTVSCAATLDGTHTVTITWASVVNAQSYRVYRSTSGGTPANLSLVCSVALSAARSCIDDGSVNTASFTDYLYNTTGGIVVPVSPTSLEGDLSNQGNYPRTIGSGSPGVGISFSTTDIYFNTAIHGPTIDLGDSFNLKYSEDVSWSNGGAPVVGVGLRIGADQSGSFLTSAPGVMDVGFGSYNTNTSYVNSQGNINTYLDTAGTLAAGDVVKFDTSNAGSVLVNTTANTGPGIAFGVNLLSTGAGLKSFIITRGITSLPKLGTGTCAIGQFVIVDTTTNGRVKCVTTYPSNTGILGIATAAQVTVGNAVTMLLVPNPSTNQFPTNGSTINCTAGQIGVTFTGADNDTGFQYAPGLQTGALCAGGAISLVLANAGPQVISGKVLQLLQGATGTSPAVGLSATTAGFLYVGNGTNLDDTSTIYAASLTRKPVTGTNGVGNDLTTEGGLGTGNAVPAKHYEDMPTHSTSSSTTSQTYIHGAAFGHVKSGLTNNTNTSIIDVLASSNSTNSISVYWKAEATDGTDFQTGSGWVTYDCINKAGTMTGSTPVAFGTTTPVATSGTLTVTFASTTGTAKCTLQINSNSTVITPTSIRVRFTVFGEGFANSFTLL